MPRVSILIPCYNAAKWLPQTLESALAQTWTDKEIIVVDDGSTDDSAAILRLYERRGVRIIFQPNAGQSAAFNRAMAVATGQFLEFLDADDLLAPDKIAVQMELAATLPPDRLITGMWARFQQRTDEARFQPNSLWESYLDPVTWLVAAWTNLHMMHGAAWLIPAQLAQSAGGWNPELSLINDFEFFSRVLLRSGGAQFCPAAKTYYRSNISGSLSGSHSPAAWRSAFTSTLLGTANVLARENSARTRRACASVWAAFYYDSYPAVPELRRDARKRIASLGEPLGKGPGGPKFQLAARVLGWHLARRLQLATTYRRPKSGPTR